MTYYYYQDASGEWRWRLQAANGRNRLLDLSKIDVKKLRKYCAFLSDKR
ncbi:MAG TPA: hypothetical protein VJT71_06270 [Pyrinomonadaceae bacterium]|nr:hypothetical protein [Pyrinomonadaceae bacterium]